MESMIQSILNMTALMNDFSRDHLGVDLFMIFAVYFMVAIFTYLFNLRGRFQDHKNIVIMTVCLISSFILNFVSNDYESTRAYVKSSIYLSTITSFGHGFFKGFYKLLVYKFIDKIQRITGKKHNIDVIE